MRDDPEQTIWLAQTLLLVLADDEALVGVPNIFVREVMEATYRQPLERALSARVGRPLRLQIVIARRYGQGA